MSPSSDVNRLPSASLASASSAIIIGFNVRMDKQLQKDRIHSHPDSCVLYPTHLALNTVDFDHSMPYSSLMRKGTEQFEIVYFNIEILERVRHSRAIERSCNRIAAKNPREGFF